jgi:uncharacterized protein
MPNHHHINYIEIPASSLEASKDFFAKVFGWEFVDYGPDYCSFLNAGIDGGFYRFDQKALTETGSVLVVLYSSDLESSLAKVQEHGGAIIKPIFSFPGGRRFQFLDPSGNEFAVWSE